jgi:hypothetical protein
VIGLSTFFLEDRELQKEEKSRKKTNSLVDCQKHGYIFYRVTVGQRITMIFQKENGKSKKKTEEETRVHGETFISK